MNQRLDQAASQARGHGPVPRLVLYDIAYPETQEEYASTGGQAVMLITAVSHKKVELPLKNVRIVFGGSEVLLQRLRSVSSDMSKSEAPAVKAFGRYREDALYLLPVTLRLNASAMLFDFAKNESDARLAFGPLPESIVAMTAAQVAVPPTQDGLDQFIKKEYPSFFKD